MTASTQNIAPLVSIIIPSYNHGGYLKEAVASIVTQHYPATEIVIVDDGSQDNTKEIVKEIQGISYIYQQNQGLSAARNTGIKNCTGDYLIFLDADDWLLPGSIATNVQYLQANNDLAFVSGAHDKVFVDKGEVRHEYQAVSANHYQQFLQGNYIGMHATVMYRRQVFDEFSFDVSLRACEDYDLYLNVSRKYPVLHHEKNIAAYRLHSTNMSGNIPLMLKTVLKVLDRQQVNLETAAEKDAFQRGHEVWKDYYTTELLKKLSLQGASPTEAEVKIILKYRPGPGFKYILKNNAVLKPLLKKNMPGFAKRWLHKLGMHNSYLPAIGTVDGGDFDRLQPFCSDFGFSRGGPVDRYYIENFLKKESGDIKGRVLEIGDNEYSLMFGGSKITQSDILHVDASNTKATFIGDLSDAPHVPDNSFDCIVLTQTLHLIYNYKGALDTCYRILKPGGVLLLTSPVITSIDRGEWSKTWYWSFTDKALQRMVSEAFPSGKVEVNSFGNVYVATAFLYGMGVSEVSKEKFDYQDSQFQVIITVKAVKGPNV